MSRAWRIIVVCAASAAVLAGSASPTAAAAQTVAHHPRVPGARPSHGTSGSFGWSSSNWSGYAVTGQGFTSVTGSWVVPTVTGSKRATYSSNWIGIDGFSNGSLIQTGTEQDFSNGHAHYAAWWEILPAAETVISSITVRAGDRFSASVSSNGNGTWTITITDNSTGRGFTTVQSYSGPKTSAEWIEEAPTVGGRIANLANYGTATFDPGTVNGVSPKLTAADGGVMIQHGIQVSTPSNPDSDADGFNMRYGSTSPAPPAS